MSSDPQGLSERARSTEERFYLLDVLRGLAACVVVLWHWPGYQSGGGVVGGDVKPLGACLSLAYDFGYLAVPFFFMLSGFIMHRLYGGPVRAGSITFYKFFGMRLSRLYPLHVLTLAMIGGLQLAYSAWCEQGKSFVYGHNDIYHLVLNALFLQSSGLEYGFSFNGPSWSVSVEMVMYALLFLLLRSSGHTWLVAVSMVVLGRCVSYWLHVGIGAGLECFFLGTAISMVYAKHWAHLGSVLVRRWLLAASAVAWGATWAATLPSLQTHFRAWDYAMLSIWFVYALFPLSIFTALSHEETWGRWFSRAAVLGDLSYAMYMLHFPLAMVIVLLAIDVRSPSGFAGFLAVLLGASWVSYRYFELPLQRWLRARLRLSR